MMMDDDAVGIFTYVVVELAFQGDFFSNRFGFPGSVYGSQAGAFGF